MSVRITRSFLPFPTDVAAFACRVIMRRPSELTRCVSINIKDYEVSLVNDNMQVRRLLHAGHARHSQLIDRPLAAYLPSFFSRSSSFAFSKILHPSPRQ
jgi:hypothetical protein